MDTEKNGYAQIGIDSESPAADASAVSFVEVVAAVRRQFVVLLFFTVMGLAGGGVFLVFDKPYFQATATILIDTRKYPETPQADIAARTIYDSSAAIDTQVEILKSQTLTQAVVEKLALWQEPEFTKTGGGPRAMISKYLGSKESNPTLTTDEKRGRAIAYLYRNLSVKRVGGTYTIEIAFESRYADQAAKVANATAQAFIDWQRNLHRAALASAGEWLEERINDLREKSTNGQQSVAEFQAKYNIFDVGGGILTDEKRLAEMSDQLDAARTQVTDAQLKLNQITQVNGLDDSQVSDLEILSAIENVANDPSITTLRLQYLEVTAKYEQLSKLLPSSHQALIELRGQIQRAHGALVGELVRVRMMLKNNHDTAQEKVKNLQAQITAAINDSRTAATAQAALRQLQLNAQTYQNLYDSFLHRYAEALQADRSPAAEATIISRADPPSVRNYKKAMLIFAAFPAIGMLCGAGVAFVRERVGRPFWTSNDVQSALRLPCSDVIPELRLRDLDSAEEMFLHASELPSGHGKRLGLSNGNPIGYYALAKPLSRFAESLRSIRIALKINRFEGTQRAVGVTSALPNEGKSSIALALAASAASAGVRTVVVDCDFRNPILTNSWLGNVRRAGIVDVIVGDARLSDVIQVDEGANLHFVPCGVSDGHRRAGELIAHDGLAAIIDDLKGQYDLVIVDLPPMSPINDVASSQNFIDGYLLVIEWGKTKVGSVDFALNRMPYVHENVIAVVLNKVDLKKLKKFGVHIGDYYSNKYGGRYIST